METVSVPIDIFNHFSEHVQMTNPIAIAFEEKLMVSIVVNGVFYHFDWFTEDHEDVNIKDFPSVRLFVLSHMHQWVKYPHPVRYHVE